jgi:hypothetical protein
VDPLSHQFAATTEQGWDAAVVQRLTRRIAAVAQLTGAYGASVFQQTQRRLGVSASLVMGLGVKP